MNPMEIPRKRGNIQKLGKFAFSITLFAIVILLDTNSLFHILFKITLMFGAVILSEFINRVCFIFEEYRHLNSRYSGSLANLFQSVLTFNAQFFIVFVVIMFCLFYMGMHIENAFNDILNIAYFIPVLIICGVIDIVSVLYKIVVERFKELDNISRRIGHLNQQIWPLVHEWNTMYQGECPTRISYLINTLNGIDYGSAMALSYFYGYLNIILPTKGDGRKGLIDHMVDYENAHMIKFLKKKLFVLLPLSAYCPPQIDQLSKIVEPATDLHFTVLDRGGVRNRVYHNSVQKLVLAESELPVYVCAEFASPLVTLFEIMEQHTQHSAMYRQQQKEIITSFYLTLKKLIQSSRSMSGLCELIYYSDIDQAGEPLRDFDVGLLLLKRVLSEADQ